MAKEYKRTEKTQKALDALVALGGSATFAEIKAYLKEQGETLGTANLGALKREGLVATEVVEVERVTVDKVNKYVLTDADAEDTEDAE